MAIETELSLGSAMKIIAKPARDAVLVVLCTAAIVVGSYEGWTTVGEQNAKAVEARVGPVEARLVTLEKDRDAMQKDLADIRADTRVIRQEIEDRLPKP